MSIVFKLTRCAEKRWRKLNGHDLLLAVIAGVIFTDGTRSDTIAQTPQQHAA